jgi:hypothetical protein
LQASSITRAPWLSWLKRLSSKQEIPSSNLGGALFLFDETYTHVTQHRFYGVMVSTQDSESCDPSSNLGRTLSFCLLDCKKNLIFLKLGARPGFEPGTSRTLSENHTPRPTSPWLTCHLRLQTLKHSRRKPQFSPTGSVAQWIRHLTTNQGIAGSSPARVNKVFEKCNLLDYVKNL